MDAPPRDTEPIACTLDASALSDRVTEWGTILATVTDRRDVPDGLRLTFPDAGSIGEIARLAAAEHACCRFFSFTITLDERGAALEVRAPLDARPVLDALFGA